MQSNGKGVFTKDPETGMIVATPGNEYFAIQFASDLQAMNEYEAASRQVYSQFFEGNPVKTVWERIEEPIRRMIREEYGDLTTTQQEQNAILEFEQRNKDRLYAPTGDLTDEGKLLYQTIDQIQEAANDPQRLLALAEQLAWKSASPTQGGATPPPTPPATPQAAPVDTFLNEALRNASHSASASGAASAPPPQDDPGHLTQHEIENAFRLEHRRAAANV